MIGRDCVFVIMITVTHQVALSCDTVQINYSTKRSKLSCKDEKKTAQIITGIPCGKGLHSTLQHRNEITAFGRKYNFNLRVVIHTIIYCLIM